jgi:hypothetical protein
VTIPTMTYPGGYETETPQGQKRSLWTVTHSRQRTGEMDMSRRHDLLVQKARATAAVPDVIYCLHQGYANNGQLWETFFDGNAWDPDQQVPGVGMIACSDG